MFPEFSIHMYIQIQPFQIWKYFTKISGLFGFFVSFLLISGFNEIDKKIRAQYTNYNFS